MQDRIVVAPHRRLRLRWGPAATASAAKWAATTSKGPATAKGPTAKSKGITSRAATLSVACGG